MDVEKRLRPLTYILVGLLSLATAQAYTSNGQISYNHTGVLYNVSNGIINLDYDSTSDQIHAGTLAQEYVVIDDGSFTNWDLEEVNIFNTSETWTMERVYRDPTATCNFTYNTTIIRGYPILDQYIYAYSCSGTEDMPYAIKFNPISGVARNRYTVKDEQTYNNVTGNRNINPSYPSAHFWDPSNNRSMVFTVHQEPEDTTYTILKSGVDGFYELTNFDYHFNTSLTNLSWALAFLEDIDLATNSDQFTTREEDPEEANVVSYSARAYWDFNDDYDDQIPANGVGTPSTGGTPVRHAGKFDNCVQLDDNGDYLAHISASGLNITGSQTIEGWINATEENIGSYVHLVGNKKDGETSGVRTMIDDNGYIYCFFAGLTDVDAIGTTNLTDADHLNTYHHYACRYNGTHISAFVDGVEEASDPATGSITLSPFEWTIGRKPVTGGSQFYGEIDEVRITAEALDPSEFGGDGLPDSLDNDQAYTFYGQTFNQSWGELLGNWSMKRPYVLTTTYLGNNIFNDTFQLRDIGNDFGYTGGHYLYTYPNISAEGSTPTPGSWVGKYPAGAWPTTRFYKYWSNASENPDPGINTTWTNGVRSNLNETAYYWAEDNVDFVLDCNVTAGDWNTTDTGLDEGDIYDQAYNITTDYTILNISCVDNVGNFAYYNRSIPTWYGNISIYDEENPTEFFNVSNYNITLYAILEDRAYSISEIDKTSYYYTLNGTPVYFRAIMEDEGVIRSRLPADSLTKLYLYDYNAYASSEILIQIETVPYTDPVRVTRLYSDGELIVHEAYPVGTDQEVTTFLMNNRPYNVYAFPEGDLLDAVRITDILPTGADTLPLSIPDIVFSIVNVGDNYVQFTADDQGNNEYDITALATGEGALNITIYDENDTVLGTATYTDGGALTETVNITTDGTYFRAVFLMGAWTFERSLSIPSSISFIDLGYFSFGVQETSTVFFLLITLGLAGSIVTLTTYGMGVGLIVAGAFQVLTYTFVNLMDISFWIGIFLAFLGGLAFAVGGGRWT